MIKGLNRTPPNPGETKEENWIFTAAGRNEAGKKENQKKFKKF